MSATENGADDVGRQYRETEEPRDVRRNDALGFGNVLEGQASLPSAPGQGSAMHFPAVFSGALRRKPFRPFPFWLSIKIRLGLFGRGAI